MDLVECFHCGATTQVGKAHECKDGIFRKMESKPLTIAGRRLVIQDIPDDVMIVSKATAQMIARNIKVNKERI